MASFALGVYNITVAWYRLSKSGTEFNRHSFVIYAKEVVVYMGITVSKGLLCGFFAYIRMTRSEESNYSIIDLKWRSSLSCNIAGTIALVGCQIPILTLAVFAIAFLIFDASSKKWRRKKLVTTNRDSGSLEDGFYPSRDSKVKNGNLNYFATLMACLALVIIIWLPVATIVTLLQTPSDLQSQTETYGWVVARKAPHIFQANLISQDNAMSFVSKLVALSQNTTEILTATDSTIFSFAKFSDIVNSISPRLRLESLGTFGYFSQSGSCLPAFLVHVTGGQAPFDIAVSNLGLTSLSVFIMATNFALIFCTGVLTTRYGAGVSKICTAKPSFQKRHHILSRTFSRLVAIETITWIVITLSFLLKSIDPKIATDRTYATICIVAIGLNCGIVSPFVLLMRKFRVGGPTDEKRDTPRSRSRKRSSDEQRIIEEKQRLAGDESDKSYKDVVQSPETRSLVENISDE